MIYWISSIATDATLRFNNPYPKWTFLIIIPLVFFFVYAMYQRERGLSSFSRNILILLRVAVILSLFFLIFEPVLEKTESRINKSIVLLLVDDSKSMTLKDNYASANEELRDNLLRYFNLSEDELREFSRIDLVNKILNKDQDWFKTLDQEAELKVFRFSDFITPEVPIGALEAKGQKTALGDAMVQTLKDFRGKSVSSMILITDGGSNSGQDTPEEAAKLLKERNIPLYIVGVGDPEEPKDLWITNVNASKVLYKREIFTADLSLSHNGFKGRRVKVYMMLNDQVLETTDVELGNSIKTQSIQLTHRFKREGTYNITFKIQKQNEERIVVNNQYIHRLKVLDKKIKVLYLEGYPRWEYRYLKNALIRDTKMMEVHCFLYSADHNFPQEISKSVKTGLKSFPDDEMLATFDVILFGDIAPEDGNISFEQQKSIVNFVENLGGGIAFISGPRATPRRYVRTPLEKLIPIVIQEDLGKQNTGTITKSFRPKLTNEGLKHPILRLLSDVKKNKKFIEKDLPGFFWYYPAVRAKPTALELLVHPTIKDETKLKKPVALMVTQVFGTGRTLFMGLDSTWRWRYIIGDKYFYNLWAQAIRYLSKGRLEGENKRFLLKIDRTNYHVGDQVQISLKVLDVKFKPSDAKSQEVFLDREEDGSGKLSGNKVKIELKPDKNRPGYFLGSHLISQEGTYKIWTITGATQGKESENEVSQRFYASFPIIEFENPKMAEERLKELVQKPKEFFFYPYQIEEMAKKVKAPSTKFHINTMSEELWDKWYNLFIFLALISCEWILRKLNKLL